MQRTKTILILFCSLLCIGQAMGQLTITAATSSAQCDDANYCLDVTADDFTDVSAFQFSMDYDPVYWTFDQVGSSFHVNLFPNDNPTISEVAFSWFEFPAVTNLPNGSLLFEVCFTPTGETGSTSFPFIDGANTPIQFADGAGMLMTQNVDFFFNDGSASISDTENPTITCPTDTMVLSGTSTAIVNNIAATSANDNCIIDEVSFTITGVTTAMDTVNASGQLFNEGISNVNYTITDQAGNSGNCAFNVEVMLDPTADTIFQFIPNINLDCVNNTVELCVAANNFEEIVGLQVPILWDTAVLEYVSTVVNLPPTSTVAEAGAANGVMAFFYNASPAIPNGLTIADGDTMFCTTFNLKTAISDPLFNFTDIPGLAISINDDEPYEVLPENFQVTDNTDPIISNCPTDTTIMTSNCSAVFTWTGPMASDDCSTVTLDSTHASGDSFPLGTTTVTYTAMDLAGNMVSCSFDVTVMENVDPVLSCPADTVIAAIAPVTVNDIAPTVSDNCGIETLTFTITGVTTGTGNDDASGTAFNAGISTVEYVAVDSSGNSVSCTFTVQIDAPNPPQIDCPSDTSVASTVTDCSAIVNDIAPTLVSAPINIDSISYVLSGATTGNGLNDASGSTFNFGTTIVTYTATDLNGLTGTCDFEVSVIDTIAPMINCVSLDAFQSAPGQCGLTVTNNLAATASDACGIQSIDYVFTGATAGSGSGDPTGMFFNVGITTITYTATDNNGNTSTCSTNVWIADTEAPTLVCPNDTTVITAGGSLSTIVTNIDGTFDDNCNPPAPTVLYQVQGATTILLNNGSASGATFNVGTSTVTYYATDTTGNIDSCMFDVIVEVGVVDLIDCPNDTIVENDLGICGTTVNDIAPILLVPPAQIASISYNITDSTMASGMNDASGTTFNVGLSTVEYIAEDINGNMDTCTFVVRVNDTERPVWNNCSIDTIFAFSASNSCETVVSWIAPTSSDNCAVIDSTISHNPGDVFPVGFTTVTYTAQDAASNTETCEFVVAVFDTFAPVINSCPTDTIIYADEDCMAIAMWDEPAATDPCGVAVTNTHNSGDVFPLGTTQVSYYFTDPSGNQDSCQFNVEVRDTLPAIMNCPAELVVMIDGTVVTDDLNLITGTTANASCDAVAIDFIGPLAVDGCDGSLIVSQVSGPISGSDFMLGTSTMSFTATDGSGNISTCTFDLNVIPLGSVEIQIVGGDTVCTGETVNFNIVNSTAGANYNWTGPEGWTATGTNPTRPAISITQGGTYSVVCDLAGGCTNTGSVDLVVEETPSISASSNSPICVDGNQDLTLFGTEETGPAITDWSWTGPGFTSAVQNPVISNALSGNAGTYTVVGSAANGCSATAETEVVIGNIVTPTLTSDCNEILCVGETCTLLGSDFANPDVTYMWDISPSATAGIIGDTDKSSIEIMPTAPGIYVVSYSAIVDGCTTEVTTLTIEVEGAPVAMDNTFVVEYETVMQFGDVLGNDEFNSDLGFTITLLEGAQNGFAVLGPDGNMVYEPNQGFIGNEVMTYEICHNCSTELCATAQVTIEVVFDGECKVPTVLTSNQDGINDRLIVNCIESGDFPNNSLVIYNMWGDEIFSASPYQNNWDGTWDGKDLPDGTYYYVFKETESSDPEAGAITLIR